MSPASIPIIVGHHGYMVLVEDESEWARVVRSDHRGVHDETDCQVRYEDAGGREKAVAKAVAMALRLNDTATAELRAALTMAGRL